ncbi:hypothetical protein ACFE04_014096 [Oxalis oulophora]
MPLLPDDGKQFSFEVILVPLNGSGSEHEDWLSVKALSFPTRKVLRGMFSNIDVNITDMGARYKAMCEEIKDGNKPFCEVKLRKICVAQVKKRGIAVISGESALVKLITLLKLMNRTW